MNFSCTISVLCESFLLFYVIFHIIIFNLLLETETRKSTVLLLPIPQTTWQLQQHDECFLGDPHQKIQDLKTQ